MINDATPGHPTKNTALLRIPVHPLHVTQDTSPTTVRNQTSKQSYRREQHLTSTTTSTSTSSLRFLTSSTQNMQRHTPVSPPIHHPVPQRPVQVPVMQSPPPPPHSSDPYDNPYGGGGAQQYPQQGNAYPQFGGFGGAAAPAFFADPMTAQMGFNVARAAMSGGTDLAEKNVCA